MARPLIFDSREELQEKIDEYFNSVPYNEYTVFGLCLALGVDYETIRSYGRRERFHDIIKNAKSRIAGSYELDLRKKGRSGDIFALKQFGWSDNQRIEHTGAQGSPLFMPMQVVDRYNLPVVEAETLEQEPDFLLSLKAKAKQTAKESHSEE